MVDTVVNQVRSISIRLVPLFLAHVAGLNKTISENIVKYREEEGMILSRAQIKSPSSRRQGFRASGWILTHS